MPYTLVCNFTTSRYDSSGNTFNEGSTVKYAEDEETSCLLTVVVLVVIYLMPYTFTVLVTVLVSMHRYCAVCKPAVMMCARISASAAAAATRSSSRFSPSTAPQARRRVAVLALFSIIYNIPRFFEYEPIQHPGAVVRRHLPIREWFFEWHSTLSSVGFQHGGYENSRQLSLDDKFETNECHLFTTCEVVLRVGIILLVCDKTPVPLKMVL